MADDPGGQRAARPGRAYPALRAVLAGHIHGGTLATQLAVSAAVLGGYLVLAVRAA